MKSPFPGMDPYLEQYWLDVHGRLVTYTTDLLNGRLPGDLTARMEQRVLIDESTARTRAVYPDVRVYEDAEGQAGGPAAIATEASVAKPVLLDIEFDKHVEQYVTIVDAAGEWLVTTIEFLSPAKKAPGKDRDDYLRKRDGLVAANVNVVEVDLLRAGSWRELLGPCSAPGHLHTAYRAMSRRASRTERVEFFPISLRKRLPVIPIPLRPTDRDVALDLQALVDQAYQNGRYDRTRYDRPLEPPLEGDDAAWAAEVIKQGWKR